MDRIEDIARGTVADSKARYFNRKVGTEFKLNAAVDSAGASQIEVYDEIGYWGVTAKDFIAELKGITGDVVVKINSPGGDVFDGIAIYNALVGHAGNVRIEVMGLAASAASLIAMAGKEIAVAENGFLMIHNAWTIAYGNRHDLADAATVLGKIDGALARTYANRSGVGIRTISTLMDEETWFTGAEAKAKGLATEVLKPVEAKARFDLTAFAHAPSAFALDKEDVAKPETVRDVEHELMRDAGPRTRTEARALIQAAKHSPAKPDAGGPDQGAELILAALRSVPSV